MVLNYFMHGLSRSVIFAFFLACVCLPYALAADEPACLVSSGVSLQDILAEGCAASVQGVDQKSVRFAVVDSRVGTLIRFGAAVFRTSSASTEFFDSDENCGVDDDDEDDEDNSESIDISDIDPGQQVAFITDDPSDPREISKLWILDCSIVQDR